MKRSLLVAAVFLSLTIVLSGCATAPTEAPEGPKKPLPTSVETTGFGTTVGRQHILLGKTAYVLDRGATYDPATIDFAAMDGEPSTNEMFMPAKPEGKKQHVYPKFDTKTFKFLSIAAAGRPIPQRYYMFEKDGGTLNKALASTGYKAASVYDNGDNKILPNFYVGYYDFAWTLTGHIAENWIGHESRQQELWKAGDNYVIIGASYNDGISLFAPSGITDLKQLGDKTIGMMLPSLPSEAAFNSMLSKVGMATESAGGNVGIVMASPAPINNDLIHGVLPAAFVRGAYKKDLISRGFHELANTTSEFGGRLPYAVLVVRRDILEKHPEIVQIVVQANYDASVKAKKDAEWATKETDLTIAYLNEFGGSSQSTANPQKVSQIDAEANPVFLKYMYDYMKDNGYFAKPYAYERLVDDSFYKKIKK